jgi:RNA polymerase sigma-70 factor (ECF subfamily)
VYAYVRRRGYGPEEAQDLTQGFFAELLERRRLRAARKERGRFRSFLLASVKNYLANEWDRAHAKKRGGESVVASLDFESAERKLGLASVGQASPEKVFERRWAATLLERVLEKLRAELEASGHRERANRLLPLLTDETAGLPYKTIAAELGMSESAVKVAVHRMRKRYGALLREEVAELVEGPDQVDGEIRHLFSAVDPESP